MKRATIGIYRIRCKRSNYVYIGGAERCILNRWSVHLTKLRQGLHTKKFQQDYNKYGETSFVLELLEVCKKGKVRMLEQKYLDAVFGKQCYNIHPKSNEPTGCKYTDDNHVGRSTAAIARCTPEWREEVSKRVKLQHAEGNLGQATWTIESRAIVLKKNSVRMKGLSGANHPAYGRITSPESRERYSQAAIKRETKKRKVKNVQLQSKKH